LPRLSSTSPEDERSYFHSARLNVSLPVSSAGPQAPVDKAHLDLSLFKVMRGNIEIMIKQVG
jgi:hypothetical protein